MTALHSTVYLTINGETKGWGPGDAVPETIARLIGAHAFEDGVHPFPDVDGDGVKDRGEGDEPPRGGVGSGKDSWVAYAREVGFHIPEEATTRDLIIEAMVSAGVIQ